MDLRPEDLETLLDGYALDVLDDDERAVVEALLDRDPALAERVHHLEAVTGLLGTDAILPTPAPLRDGLIAAARADRPRGQHLANPLGSALAPREVYRRQSADLHALLELLSPADWDAPTSYDRPVRELLAHLSAVLEVYATELGAGSFFVPAELKWDHWGMTEATIAELSPDPSRVVAALLNVDARIVARLDELTDDEMGHTPPDAFLTVADRTRQQVFELWMHCDDVRRSIGAPLLDPDPERLAALCDLAARAVPLGMAITGRAKPGCSGRLVLLGQGGGTWITPLDPGSVGAAEAVTIIAPALDFCRLAGKLYAIDDVDFDAEGDTDLVSDVLVGAQAFAV